MASIRIGVGIGSWLFAARWNRLRSKPGVASPLEYLAKRYNVRNAAVNRANQRLAFFTDILGEAKMTKYTQGIQGLDYREGLFLQTRPGLVASPPPQPLPPLPG